MPFGLKNADATYPRLVNKMFTEQLGKTMEVYIDDMLVKSLEEKDHVKHLQDCFEQLNLHNMKLNPAKCRFTVTSGVFLGYLVTHRGIEANPKQTNALIEMASPRTKQEVQRMTGRAFQDLKVYLVNPPVLAKPVEGEPLFLYIAVSLTAVSGVLFNRGRNALSANGEGSLSCRNVDSETETILPVALDRSLPLRSILHNPSELGRLAKWAVELSEYDIEYRNMSCAKSLVLADFLIELPTEGVETEGVEELTSESTWTLHIDAEYETLIAGLRLALDIRIQKIRAFCDSQIVANRRMKAYLKVVQELTKQLEEFELTRIPRGENASADALAALASTSDPGLRRVIPVESIDKPDIGVVDGVNLINPPEEEQDMDEDVSRETTEYGSDKEWMGAIRTYIADGEVPSDRWAAQKLKAQALLTIADGNVFKWQFSGPLLTCIKGAEARKIMEEAHSGAYGNHASGRSLAIKIKRHGYYWPTMVKDCEKFSVKCEKCQARPNHPSAYRTIIISLGSLSVYEVVNGHRQTFAKV
ncbi:uncharacterized protein LOC112083520 [Eutrema salsugineum]|uniref:uncharacterized protein LOC112083520 n=1 Tax=Eutrema salsugineum TaxID=72664 RepID=UPI000CECF28A|nr:uncharacterized protein LOC112083520 [Eutrema salsugineum]